ncbi:hypothetical protein PQX77_018354 [Marasmius sp. AFHP31]|nr:hypothetical protein PQX77_018354 [Marasmius sp. AFHP31]
MDSLSVPNSALVRPIDTSKKEKDEKLIAIARGLEGAPSSDEYEKMISGMHFNTFDPSLTAVKQHARCLTYKYNNLDPSMNPSTTPREILEELLGKVGDMVHIEQPFRVDYGCNTIVGDRCFFNFGLTILDASLVTFGNQVAVGPNVSIFSVLHYTSPLSRVGMYQYGLPVTIEDNCWIGGGTIILPGVTIGRGTTIGAGSVVTRDIPPNSVAIGIPAKVIKTVQGLEEEMKDEGSPFRESCAKIPQ